MIAFASPNYPPLAKAGIDIEYNEQALQQAGKYHVQNCEGSRKENYIMKKAMTITLTLMLAITVFATLGTGTFAAIPSDGES